MFVYFKLFCLKNFIFIFSYFSGVSWDAMLKFTGVKLQKITDIRILLFIELGIRGGVSQVCNRYTRANHPYMQEDFNPEESIKYLSYFDANNLYGWAMSQYLPFEGFKFVENPENLDIHNISDESDIGYIFEVDLDYPDSLHDDHKDLPFCPQHMKPPGSRQVKLMTTLHHKKNYVIHYRALKQALKNGLQIKENPSCLTIQSKSMVETVY